MKGDPLTGSACGCKRRIERDNCPNCEGTGKAIDWRKFHANKGPTPQVEPTWAYGFYTGRAVVTKNQKGGVK